MHDSNCTFGQVRSVSFPTTKLSEIMDHCINCGWHKCSDLYYVERAKGTDNYLLIFTVGGTGRLEIGGTYFLSGADHIFIIPPHVPNKYYVPAGGQWEIYWIEVSGANASNLLSYIVDGHGYCVPASIVRELVGCIELIINKPYQYFESEIEIAKLIAGMIFKVFEYLSADEMYAKSNNLVAQVIKYIEDHYKDDVCLKDICGFLYVSPEHMIRVFKQKVGITPYRYLKRHRILKSCLLLEYTNEPVKRIAAEVGYSNASNYTFQFRKEMHMPPEEYRKLKKVYKS